MSLSSASRDSSSGLEVFVTNTDVRDPGRPAAIRGSIGIRWSLIARLEIGPDDDHEGNAIVAVFGMGIRLPTNRAFIPIHNPKPSKFRFESEITAGSFSCMRVRRVSD